MNRLIIASLLGFVGCGGQSGFLTDAAPLSDDADAVENTDIRDGAGRAPGNEPCGDSTPVGVPPREIAERLSRLILASEPTQALLADAEGGNLDTYGEVECQSTRMVREDAAWRGMQKLLESWLEVESWPHPPREEIGDVLWSEMRREAAMLVEATARSEDATLNDLLSTPLGETGVELAAHYDGDPVSGGETDAGPERRGFLSLGMLNASLSRIVGRGLWVTHRLACYRPPPPPEGTITRHGCANEAGESRCIDEQEAEERGQSFRRMYEMGIAQATSCTNCHALFDGPGLALEAFDRLGRPRTEDAGMPVDTSGTFFDTEIGDSEAAQRVSDLDELLAGLGGSRVVAECAAGRALEHAIGADAERLSAGQLAADREAIRRRFEGADRKLRELLVALTQTESFWHPL